MKYLLFLIFLGSVLGSVLGPVDSSAQGPVGAFDGSRDIGKPKLQGWAKYDEAAQTYSMQGSGYNIWFNRDEFQYAYKKTGGDFLVTADFGFIGEKGNGHRKTGWMVRESLDEAAASMNAVIHGDGLTVMQWRALRGAYMRDPQDEIFAAKRGYQILQLERKGKTFIMRAAHPGEPLQVIAVHEMPDMPDSVYTGLFVSSHDPESSEQAKIWNVRIDKPVMNDYSPNPQVHTPSLPGEPGSRLEVLDIRDGRRRVVYASKEKFESPNWMPDGKTLLFNQGGGLYTVPLEGGSPQSYGAGSLHAISNDHGISKDGKWLAISSDLEGGAPWQSAVYVMPLGSGGEKSGAGANGAGGSSAAGRGEPRQVTRLTPSYWHGWSPNGKEILVTAQRPGSKSYNIYKVVVSSGEETALTNTSGHADGAEYSPDGKTIYYTDNSTGSMQLWRMKPDGSGKEALSFDEYQNWFPHVSPDGKWVVFLSFAPGVDPNGPSAYQRVLLRMMPASGGAPRVIAYLYGGHGSLNGPCWSPDSRHIVFVSNSEITTK